MTTIRTNPQHLRLVPRVARMAVRAVHIADATAVGPLPTEKPSGIADIRRRRDMAAEVASTEQLQRQMWAAEKLTDAVRVGRAVFGSELLAGMLGAAHSVELALVDRSEDGGSAA